MGTLVTDARGVPLSYTATPHDKPSGDGGDYAESVLASSSEVTLTTTQAKSVTSVRLVSGEWDISGVVDFDLTGVSATKFIAGVSSTNNTLGSQDTFSQTLTALTTITGVHAQVVPVTRLVLNTATTIYLIANATFSAGTLKAYGTIRARRIK